MSAMGKKIDILIDGGLFAFYMFGAALVSLLAEMLIVRVITLFVGMDYFTLCLLRAVIYTVSVNVILGTVSYRSGYKSAAWQPVATAVSGLLALIPLFLFCLLFSFEAFCAGGVKFLTAIIKFGPSLSLDSFEGTLNRFDCIPYFFLNGILSTAVMVIARKPGADKRILDRAELTKESLQTNEQDRENL